MMITFNLYETLYLFYESKLQFNFEFLNNGQYIFWLKKGQILLRHSDLVLNYLIKYNLWLTWKAPNDILLLMGGIMSSSISLAYKESYCLCKWTINLPNYLKKLICCIIKVKFNELNQITRWIVLYINDAYNANTYKGGIRFD